MKNILFLLSILLLSSCATKVITEKECQFACMNEGHSLKKVEENCCLCEMKDKKDAKLTNIPTVKVKVEE